MERWGLKPGSIDGLDAIVDRVRGAYARVEALAARYPAEAAEDAGWRVERVAGADPHHAWMYKTRSHKARKPSGLVAGLRLVVKDSIAVAGVPMTAGGALLRDFVPARSAVAVDRALAAGATLAGTAVCEDLCYSGSSFTSVTGPVRNPYDLERAAGGSTSGCAVLLATRQADLALGTDLGGSVRNPASWCGISALKPTFGLAPYTGALATELSMDHLGLMARTAREIALLLDAVAGPTGSDPRQAGTGALRGKPSEIEASVTALRIGIVTDGFGWPDRSDPDHDRIVRQAIDALSKLCAGAAETSVALHRHARDIHVPIASEGGLATVFEQNSQASNHAGLNDPDLAFAFGCALAANPAALPLNGKIAAITATVLRAETKGRTLALAQALRAELRAQYDRALERFDVLAMPTVPMAAHRLPSRPLTPAEHQALAFEMHDNNCAMNLTGHPALSVPCGMVGGLPAGMLLIGRRLDDHLLLRLAHRFQTQIFAPPSPPGIRPGSEFRDREQGAPS